MQYVECDGRKGAASTLRIRRAPDGLRPPLNHRFPRTSASLLTLPLAMPWGAISLTG